MNVPGVPWLALHDPWWLLLIVLPLSLLVLEASAGGGWRVTIPAAGGLRSGTSMRALLRRALPPLRAAGLAMMIVAMARPIGNRQRSPVDGQGIDIALVVDVSSSMRETDMSRGESRLDVVKRVLAKFVAKREGDRMGLIAFARYPVTVCPFTLDSGTVAKFVDKLDTAMRFEDGTAIGVAVAQASRRLKKSTAKSRIIVLLTDGANNVWDVTPEEAGVIASELKIKVYTILAGREQQNLRFRADEQIDAEPLVAIARETGGKFFRAQDEDTLDGIYREIDRLEKSKFSEARYESFTDLFWMFATPGLFVMMFASVLDHTWLRRLP